MEIVQTRRRYGDRDEALVDLARARDPHAIREIIRANNRRLFRVARAVLRDDAEAEDVVQETYVRAFSQLSSFRGDAAIGTWLTRIALNEALGRKRRRHGTVDLEELNNMPEDDSSVLLFRHGRPPSTPEAALGRSEVRDLLRHAIDGLPQAFRLVFILRDVEGLDIEETADHLGIRPATVKTRLFRARRLLRRALEAELSAGMSDLFPFDGARCVSMAERVIDLLSGKLKFPRLRLASSD